MVKMNPSGTALLYSVVLGGGLTDIGGGIAVDTAGNAYITGYTNSSYPSSASFPVTPGAPQTAAQRRVPTHLSQRSTRPEQRWSIPPTWVEAAIFGDGRLRSIIPETHM